MFVVPIIFVKYLSTFSEFLSSPEIFCGVAQLMSYLYLHNDIVDIISVMYELL